MQVRLDDAVMETDKAWAAKPRKSRHIGDFSGWKDQESCQKALNRLLRDQSQMGFFEVMPQVVTTKYDDSWWPLLLFWRITSWSSQIDRPITGFKFERCLYRFAVVVCFDQLHCKLAFLLFRAKETDAGLICAGVDFVAMQNGSFDLDESIVGVEDHQ